MSQVIRIELENEEQLTKLQILLGSYFFRGHSESKWQLTSSLERICSDFEVAPDKTAERERNALLEFQRRAHHHLSDCPEQKDYLEWLALMQHHGGPTRLVDVTHSIFVAMFFALENAREEASVWAFNTGKLTSATEPEGPRRPESKALQYANQVLLGRKKEKGVRIVKPFRLNRRLADQQGAFLMPMSVEESFEKQLGETLGVNLKSFKDISNGSWNESFILADVVKIIIGRESHSRLLRFLSSSNISATTLFDGLDGFARSLKTTFRLYD